MRAFLGFVTFASFASQEVSGHRRILVIQVQVPGQAARRPEHASEPQLLPLRAPGAQGIPVPRAGVEGQCLGLGGTRAGDDAEGRCGPETAVSTVLWRGAGAAAAGFPDPAKHPYTPSADMVRESEPKNRRPRLSLGVWATPA